MSEPNEAHPPRQTLLLGVDIGGTKVLAGLVDRGGHVVERRQRPTRPDHVLADTIDTCGELLAWAEAVGHEIAGIGVGAKGAVDHRRGRLVSSLYLGHGEIPMGDHLQRTFGLPVRVENDVHAATLGEQAFGIGRTTENFVFFNAGTGIAIGVVAAGKLQRGASNTAGENGHAVIDHSGRWPCACGMSGCLETMIVAGRRGTPMPELTGITPEARHDPAYSYLASSLLDVIAVFDPAAIVLGGGMLNSQNAAAEWLMAVLTSSATTPEKRLVVVPAFAGPDAGLVGSAALMLDSRPG